MKNLPTFRQKIRLNQIWKSRISDQQIIIAAKKDNNRWTIKILTNKPDFYSGTHKLHERTIWAKYELIK